MCRCLISQLECVQQFTLFDGWKAENSHNSLISCPLACTKTPKSPDLGRHRHPPLVKENFYQYQEHLKFVCILFSSTLNNFRSQITGVSDQSAPWLVLETQECYATLWYSTSIFQFNNHLTCTRTPGERRKEGERAGGCIKKWIAGVSAFFTFYSKRLTGASANPKPWISIIIKRQAYAQNWHLDSLLSWGAQTLVTETVSRGCVSCFIKGASYRNSGDKDEWGPSAKCHFHGASWSFHHLDRMCRALKVSAYKIWCLIWKRDLWQSCKKRERCVADEKILSETTRCRRV